MFSKGQLIFALVFFICFVVGIALAYRKDKDQNVHFFKGSYKVLIFAIFIFVALYGVVKLKHFF
ncbi:MAG TPA: hypothetical protein PLL00_06695 [Bacteroidia bacterium]|jgi:hypothetical protein|nr:hypothetical protein [Bacteroidia bacterium]